MAASRVCTIVARHLTRFSGSKTLPAVTNLRKTPQNFLFIVNSRWLSSTHAALAPPYSEGAQFQQRPPYQRREWEDEDEYDIDDDELEVIRHKHREEARSQHKAKEGITFRDFPINDYLTRRLENLGYKEPFVIQTDTLRETLAGRDVIAKAVTGSGKTLAFAIPIVNKLMETNREKPSRNPRAIVISPTRELCLQIHKSIQELNPELKCVPVYGGENITRQMQKMSRGVDVVCATPGRLNDLLERQMFGLGEVEFLCLDEADELLTPNFKDQIEDVLEGVPRERQMMMFSATIPKHIRSLVNAYMSDAVLVDITQNADHKKTSISHQCIKLEPQAMMPTLVTLLKQHNPERCIVFAETKVLTNSVAIDLKRMGFKAEPISSSLTQRRRENLMAAFRSGRVKILVATDVAARGIDVPEIDVIVQVKPPSNGSDYYVHRSGRTGRAGRKGVAILLHTDTYPEQNILKEIAQEGVEFEQCAPPDVSHLANTRFSTYITPGLVGRAGPKTKKNFRSRGGSSHEWSRGGGHYKSRFADMEEDDFGSRRSYGGGYSQDSGRGRSFGGEYRDDYESGRSYGGRSNQSRSGDYGRRDNYESKRYGRGYDEF